MTLERRAPMQRGKPLARGKGLERGAPMKRGKGLERGKPLARGDASLAQGAPLRRAPLARQSAKAKAAPPARKPRPVDPITEETRALVLLRCQGMCESCGDPLGNQYATHFHHRQTRALGDHSPANIVALHSVCHVIAPDAVHENPAWARERGLIVARSASPAATPLTLPSGRRVLLDAANPAYLDVADAA